MSDRRVYGLDTCDTCKKARNWLARHKVAHEFIDYREHPIAAGEAEGMGERGRRLGEARQSQLDDLAQSARSAQDRRRAIRNGRC